MTSGLPLPPVDFARGHVEALTAQSPYHEFTHRELEIELATHVSKYHYDPLGFALWAFDWGFGDLKGFDGPDRWQIDLLNRIGEESRQKGFNGFTPVLPQRHAVASGHGVGKSALTAWIILWIVCTRPHAKGVVTANTGEQLKTKTWSELAKWKAKCMVGHWFNLNSGSGSLSLVHKSFPETWRVDGITCREENSEAFAGLHNSASTAFYLFDEASAVPRTIWEVAEGGLTDGEPMIFAFGNPTRTDGAFYDCFHTNLGEWSTQQVDSRKAKMTNKELLAQWERTWGGDSDFYRVRVLGQFPRAGDDQFMPSDVVYEAQTRPLPPYMGTDPLICGIDIARGGEDNCVIAFRRGKDARSETTYFIPGERSRDSTQVVSKLTMILDRHVPDAVFVDETGIGGPMLDRLRQLGYNVHGVQFGSRADEENLYYNKTAEMGMRLRLWLLAGGCIQNHPQIYKELTSRLFGHSDRDKLVLEKKKEMKKRLGVSPDWADALYLTFAQHVAPRFEERGALDGPIGTRHTTKDYNPIDEM